MKGIAVIIYKFIEIDSLIFLIDKLTFALELDTCDVKG